MILRFHYFLRLEIVATVIVGLVSPSEMTLFNLASSGPLPYVYIYFLIIISISFSFSLKTCETY